MLSNSEYPASGSSNSVQWNNVRVNFLSTDFLGLVVNKAPVPNVPELQRTQQLKEQRVNNTETNGSY